MKKILSLFAALLLLSSQAFANTLANNGQGTSWFESPSTITDVLVDLCQPGNIAVDLDNANVWAITSCNLVSGTAVQLFPVAESSVTGLTADLAAKFDTPTGSSSQYVRGDGATATLDTNHVPENTSLYFTAARAVTALTGQNVSLFMNDAGYLPAATAASTYFPKPTGTSAQYLDGTGAPQTFPTNTPTITHPSRSLSTCFQPSSASATSFVYSVNISASILSLGGGTATVTQYNDSGCSTGALVIADGAVSSVAISGTSSIPLVSSTPAGKYLKITATASGGASDAIDTVTTERQ